jgi:hypothetical protein
MSWAAWERKKPWIAGYQRARASSFRRRQAQNNALPDSGVTFSAMPPSAPPAARSVAPSTRAARSRKAPPTQHPNLTWLFCEAEGDLGLRSSHGPLVDLALSGVSQGGSSHALSLSEKRLQAATDERRLRSRISTISPRHQLALWLAYGPQPWPREVRGAKAYGPWPGVLLLCPRARRAFERALAAKTARVPPRSPDPLVALFARKDGLLLSGPLRDTSFDAVESLARRGLGEWLRSPTTLADKTLLDQLRADARELVAEAFEAWALTGRRAFASAAEVRAAPSPRQERKRRRDLVAVQDLL